MNIVKYSMTWHGICFKIFSYSPKQVRLFMLVYSPTHSLMLFKNLILGGISQSNRHLLILDGHGSHVTLEAIGQAQAFGLHMTTLYSHTSHAL
jgi:hypothetical protein